MADAEDPPPSTPTPPGDRAPAAAEVPLAAYQKALERYEGIRLFEILKALGVSDSGTRPRALAGLVVDRLGDSRFVERLVAELGEGPRIALSLYALTETTAWPLEGLYHALACLGVEASATVRLLLELGLVAIEFADGTVVGDLARLLEERKASEVRLVAHPVVVGAARTMRPDGGPLGLATTVRHVREADGLEAVLRLGAVWQRVDEAPLRRTQQGTLYKRDRDRIEDDPVLAGPIADVFEPLPDMAALWLTLAREVGLVVDEPHSDRIVAAPPSFWAENAFHLPQMIATRWLSTRVWHEQAGMLKEDSTVELALPFVRPVVLLWLANPGDTEWVALDDLAAHLRAVAPDWDRATFLGESPAKGVTRGKGARVKRDEQGPAGGPDAQVLESLLLGAGYQLGLVRTAEEVPSGRRLVQLTPLGRYILALGPPPPPRPTFEQFLFVQPNFEIIAYRQGLTPSAIGQFSRFTRWTQVGAALEMKLTPESVYRGLEGGLAPREMLDRLARHSPRALPAGVAEAMRTWAGRRDRVTYYASATLIEFATHADLEQALAQWPAASRVAPIAISDRLLLVEDDAAIPFQRFRLTGARDYRRAPEICIEVEPDGVTLTLDLGRSDLLVDAELARFADEQPMEPSRSAPGNPRRRFLVSSASLARGAENGLSNALLAHWYLRRTGEEMPSAVRLLVLTAESRVPPLATSRPLVLHAPTSVVLDGLVQHPDTRAYLGERLGPTTVIIPDELLERFRHALATLGLTLAQPTGLAPRGGASAGDAGLQRSKRD